MTTRRASRTTNPADLNRKRGSTVTEAKESSRQRLPRVQSDPYRTGTGAGELVKEPVAMPDCAVWADDVADRVRRPRARQNTGVTDSELVSCFVCQKHHLGEAAAGGVLYEDDLVYAGHAHPIATSTAYRGYLVAEPKRHLRGLGDLTDDEAAALGRLLNRLAGALKEVAGAEHVYSFVLGHGVEHLHVVLAPRYPGTPEEYWGLRLRQWPDAPRVDEGGMRALVARLRGRVLAS